MRKRRQVKQKKEGLQPYFSDRQQGCRTILWFFQGYDSQWRKQQLSWNFLTTNIKQTNIFFFHFWILFSIANGLIWMNYISSQHVPIKHQNVVWYSEEIGTFSSFWKRREKKKKILFPSPHFHFCGSLSWRLQEFHAKKKGTAETAAEFPFCVPKALELSIFCPQGLWERMFQTAPMTPVQAPALPIMLGFGIELREKLNHHPGGV